MVTERTAYAEEGRIVEFANGCLEVFATLVIFVLFISLHQKKSEDTFEKCLTAMVICHMVVLLLDAAHWFLYQYTNLKVLLAFLSVVPTILSLIGNGVFIYFMIDFLSQRMQMPRKTMTYLILLFAFTILTWTIFILMNGIQSTANIQVNYAMMQHSWVYWVGHLGWASASIIAFVTLWRCRQRLSRKEWLTLSTYCFFPLVALILRFFWDGPQIFLATSLSLICIYAVMQREQRERLEEQENQLIQNRIAILLSQIQPHFLYNTLTAICGLCDENPKEAKKVTAEFADYLRHNLESLSQSTPVSFEDELQHTKVYLSIEQKRFEHKLNIVYDIGFSNFRIPALTVQPIVENAVKHGVTKKKNGGTVTITTRDGEDGYEIIIADDGVGFDMATYQKDPNTHIGIENVRYRLRAICYGTITVTSEVGVGTVARIKIPKKAIYRVEWDNYLGKNKFMK